MSKPTRRNLLRCIGTGAVGYGLVGNAAARTPGGGSRLVVGTDSTRGMHASRVRAERVERELDFGARGKAVVGEFSDESVAELEGRSDVRYVEEDVPVFALPATRGDDVNASEQGLPWGIERTGANVAHDQGHTGSGAHIAILDTGIDAEHPDLAPNVGEGYAIEECDDDCAAPWDDDHTHGTHCAGIAAAVDNGQGVVGVGAGATLHSVKVLSNEGSGSATGVAEGIKWAVDQGYEVISMSLGAEEGASVIRDALQYAEDGGSLVVAAAGNEGPCIDCVHYPGAYPEAVAVGAINRFDDLSEFSSTGEEVEIVAPGTDVTSTVTGGGYQSYSGTSMATPHVAGAAAVLMSEGRSAQETRELLRSSAENLGLDDRESGAGLLNLDEAVGDGGGGDDPTSLAVETLAPTDVSETAATLQGELTGLGEYDAAAAGFEFWVQGDREGTAESVDAGEMSSPGPFAAEVDGLESETTYEFVATATADDGTTVSGNVRQIGGDGGDEPAALAVETRAATDVTETEATLQGELTALGEYDEVDVGFELWVQGDREGSADQFGAGDLESPGRFSEALWGFEPGTTYEYVATATADDGTTVSGDVVQVGEDDDEDDGDENGVGVDTLEPADVTQDAATLVGNLTGLGDREAITVGLRCWVPGDREATVRETDSESRSEPGEFSGDVSGLQSDSEYVVVAYAATDDGEVLGDEVRFRTGEDDGDGGRFSITTLDADWVGDRAARLNGEVTDLGGVSEIETAFVYWPVDDESAREEESAEDVDEPDDFDELVLWLEADTTYRFAAVGYDGDGNRVVADAKEFTTDAE